MELVFEIMLFAILVLVPVSHAQTKLRQSISTCSANNRWHRFFPLDKSFSVETPCALRRMKDELSDSDPNGYKSITIYQAGFSKPKSLAYGIVVLIPSEGMRKENPKGNELGGLQLFIGGSHRDPATETLINVEGMAGKELIYDLTEYEDGGYRKGHIIDAGERIYILSFRGNKAEDLSSALAMRFFNSFHTMKNHGTQ